MAHTGLIQFLYISDDHEIDDYANNDLEEPGVYPHVNHLVTIDSAAEEDYFPRYLPLPNVVKDYLRTPRRKGDSALIEFLTITFLNGRRRYRQEEGLDEDTHDNDYFRQVVKDHIAYILDTRSEPLRDDPDALYLRKMTALSACAVSHRTLTKREAYVNAYNIETTVLLEDDAYDHSRYSALEDARD